MSASPCAANQFMKEEVTPRDETCRRSILCPGAGSAFSGSPRPLRIAQYLNGLRVSGIVTRAGRLREGSGRGSAGFHTDHVAKGKTIAAERKEPVRPLKPHGQIGRQGVRAGTSLAAATSKSGASPAPFLTGYDSRVIYNQAFPWVIRLLLAVARPQQL